MMAVCGNGLCELGEACPSTASGPCNSTTHCAQDCPVTPRSCPYVGSLVRFHRVPHRQMSLEPCGAELEAAGLNNTMKPRCCLLHGTCCAAAEQVCAGHGHCLGVTAGYCECNQGYTGPACSQCANGYVARAGGCTFLPGGSALASCSATGPVMGARRGWTVGDFASQHALHPPGPPPGAQRYGVTT